MTLSVTFAGKATIRMIKRKNQKQHDISEAVLLSIFIMVVALVFDCIVSSVLIAIGFSTITLELISNMLEGIIAAAAAGLVIRELRMNERQERRENDIQEASFLLHYNQAFIQDPNMNLVESLLEKQSVYGFQGTIITDENRQQFINYLVYLEGLAPLILNDIMRLEHIDDLMSYRFFLAVNNKELQKDQLEVFPQFYRGCFKLYKKWVEYYKKQNIDIPFAEASLDNVGCFEEYSIRKGAK